MEIRYSEKAEKQIRKIYKGNKKTAAMIMAAIESLSTGIVKKSLDIKTLKGKYGAFKRMRIGNYRIIFEDDAHILLIYEIKHRQEAYHD
jgi:mRNA-degrading endonuclease RelE of RelBE toxin-antitoxin system